MCYGTFCTAREVVFIHVDQVDKHALSHLFELHNRANLYSTSGGIWRVYLQSKPFTGANMSVLRLIMTFSPYLRSAMVQFPLKNVNVVCRTALVIPSLFNRRKRLYDDRDLKQEQFVELRLAV